MDRCHVSISIGLWTAALKRGLFVFQALLILYHDSVLALLHFYWLFIHIVRGIFHSQTGGVKYN